MKSDKISSHAIKSDTDADITDDDEKLLFCESCVSSILNRPFMFKSSFLGPTQESILGGISVSHQDSYNWKTKLFLKVSDFE